MNTESSLVFLLIGPLLEGAAVVWFVMLKRSGTPLGWSVILSKKLTSPVFPLMLFCLGVGITLAGFAPARRITVKVVSVYPGGDVDPWQFHWEGGPSHITVSNVDGERMVPGERWTCTIREVPVLSIPIGNCVDGQPAS